MKRGFLLNKEEQKELEKEASLETCCNCQKSTQYILKHLAQNKRCKEAISQEELSCLQKKAKERKSRLECERQKKGTLNETKDQTLARRKLQNDVKQASRRKQKEDNPEDFAQQNRSWKQKHRKIETAEDRLRAFRRATMFGPVFTCISCHIKHFESAVIIFTDKLADEIDAKIPLKECIYDINLVSKVCRVKEGCQDWEKTDFKKWICKTCVRHLRKGNLPCQSVMNNLQLHETDEELRAQDLLLTELEGALVAKRIIYQKIIQLPKSRYSALKDRTINVPITDDSINNTLVQLPRTPAQAGIIGLSLGKGKVKKKDSKSNNVSSHKSSESKADAVASELEKKRDPKYSAQNWERYVPREASLSVLKKLRRVGKILHGKPENVMNLDSDDDEDDAISKQLDSDDDEDNDEWLLEHLDENAVDLYDSEDESDGLPKILVTCTGLLGKKSQYLMADGDQWLFSPECDEWKQSDEYVDLIDRFEKELIIMEKDGELNDHFKFDTFFSENKTLANLRRLKAQRKMDN